MKLINKLPLMAFMLGLGLTTITAMSSFSSKPAATLYHIVGVDSNGDYIVTTSGRCTAGTSECSFTSNLTPDGSGRITKDDLEAENPMYVVQQGTFAP